MSTQNNYQDHEQIQYLRIPIQKTVKLGYLYFFPIDYFPSCEDLQNFKKYILHHYPQWFIEESAIKNSPDYIFFTQILEQEFVYPGNYFPLQSILVKHLQFVYVTQQPTFKLSNATFKSVVSLRQNYDCRDQMFWGINFTKLKYLNLSNSVLANIEGVSYCNLPFVKKLQLENNFLSSIQILSKFQFKFLQEISFYNNPLLQFDKATRIRFPNLKIIEIDQGKYFDIQIHLGSYQHRNLYEFDPVQIINFINKIEGISKLKQFRLQLKKRIKLTKYTQIMQRINPKMKIFTNYQQMQNADPIIYDGDNLTRNRLLYRLIQQEERQIRYDWIQQDQQYDLY